MGRLILFVCTGNTCRSPMAEYYFNHKACCGYKASSRGVYADNSSAMSANSQQVLLDNNISGAAGHKSAQVDAQAMRGADLIYGITAEHAGMLRADYPEYADKIRAMPENIGDPYGSDLEAYAACFGRIKAAVDIIIGELHGC